MGTVKVSSENGVPFIVVPCRSLWSLVEFLALHRVHVAYSYHGAEFRVAFPHQDVAAVEGIVSDWCAYAHGGCAEHREIAGSNSSLESAHR